MINFLKNLFQSSTQCEQFIRAVGCGCKKNMSVKGLSISNCNDCTLMWMQ